MLGKGKTQKDFACMDAKEAIIELSSSASGLSEKEAVFRLQEYGKNALHENREIGIVLEFLSHFRSPVILVMIFAAVVSFVLHQKEDAAIILVMIFLSVILDFSLEHRASEAAKKLRQGVKTRCTAIRNGEKREVDTEDIAAGDLIFLSAGSLIPADARIISAKDFFVNQSSLTGESFPVEKTAAALPVKDYSLSELSNIVLMGSSVVSGSATAIVVKTGMETEFGRIADRLSSENAETEFDRGISKFGYLIMQSTAVLVIFIFIVNTFMNHHTVYDSFMFAVAVAVGLVPELLPMIMSVTMAKGSLQMAKKGVIVKRLTAIPNFGSMDVLCTDKTGTLTEDKIKLVKYTNPFGEDSYGTLLHAYLNSYFETGIKNVLDEAVVSYKKIDVSGYEKIEEIPFDFERRKMSVVVEKDGKRILITKGAPEEIIRNSSMYMAGRKKTKLDGASSEKINAEYRRLSMEGFRVLAVAFKEVGSRHAYSKNDECGLVLLGFVAFLDPAKDDVKDVIAGLKENGIEVKIITGDNELVTKKICDDIGLAVKGILLGGDVSSMADDALRVKVEETTIFARLSPQQKDRIILALKSNGHVVGYMGDGINDAPPLKTADVGISVDSAVDVAKESASIILTQKSLGQLREGVLEGRKTFGNTMKYIMIGLSSNFGNMFSVAAAVLYLPFMPMLPVQILLNNFIYDFSQITIPTDNIDRDMVSSPKRWDMKFIVKFMIVFGLVSSVFDILAFVFLYSVMHVDASVFQTAWFMESLATQALAIFIIRTKTIPFVRSMPSALLLLSTVLCVIAGWLLPYTFVARYFSFAAVPLEIIMTISALAVAYLVTLQVVKVLFYRRFRF